MIKIIIIINILYVQFIVLMMKSIICWNAPCLKHRSKYLDKRFYSRLNMLLFKSLLASNDISCPTSLAIFIGIIMEHFQSWCTSLSTQCILYLILWSCFKKTKIFFVSVCYELHWILFFYEVHRWVLDTHLINRFYYQWYFRLFLVLIIIRMSEALFNFHIIFFIFTSCSFVLLAVKLCTYVMA